MRHAINLKKEFPLTYRRALKKSLWCDDRLFPLVGIFLVFGGALLFAPHEPMVRNILIQHALESLLLVGLIVGLVRWSIRYLKYFIEQYSFQFNIAHGNLILSKGIISKEVGSFPLSRITDIYLHREWGDFLWGLSCLQISTPTASSAQFAVIPGLSSQNAEGLRVRLEQLIKQYS